MRRLGPEGADDSVVPALTLKRRAADTPEPGMGTSLDFRLEASNAGTSTLGQIETLWINPDVADQKADMIFRTRGDDGFPPGERLRLTHDNRVEVAGELAFADDSPQRTAGPIAKAFINSDGSIANGVNIDSVSWEPGASAYRVTLSNEYYFFNGFAATVTPSGTSSAVRTASQGGDLLVYFEDAQQRSFQLVVYKLPDGVVTSNGATLAASGEATAGESVEDTSAEFLATGDANRELDSPEQTQALRSKVLDQQRQLEAMAESKADLEDRLARLEAILLDDEPIARK